MPKLLFTDEQKTALAKEAGINGVPDTNTFDREYDPSTGSQKLYMKLGNGSKFFGARPTTVKESPVDQLNSQAEYMQQKYGGKTMQDLYGAMIATTPSDKGAIRDKILAGTGGIGSQLEGITQQIANIQKLKAGNQSEIFNAIDPNTGKVVDPRIAVATFKNSQAALTNSENNLRALEDMYNAQADALTNSEYSRQAAENEKNKTALGYLKDIEDRKAANEKIATDKSQFDQKLAEERRQYNITNGIGTDTMEGLKSVSFTDLAYKYPGEASLKNNNPAGIKNNITDRTRQLLIDAGVKWEGGTKPPPGESGSYMKFASVADGLKAHRVLLTSAGTDDITARLKQWVGTAEGPAYAKQLMTAAGIPDGAKFSQLSEEQLNKLSEVHMQKESPGFYKELQKTATASTSTKKPATFNAFVEKLTIPDITLDEKGIDEMFQAVLKDYPTESLATVAQAIRNRAPEAMKKAIDEYSAKLADKSVQDTEVTAISGKLDSMTSKSTTGYLRTLDTKFPDPTKVIETLHKAGFFDVYGPHWSGDDDQYDAVQEYATKKGIDLEETLKTLNGETSTK